MFQAGLVEPIKRGHYRLTDRGWAFLKESRTSISVEDLEQFDEFRDFKSRSRADSMVEAEPHAMSSSDSTPEDRIHDALREIGTALSRELLTAVLGLSPSRFEFLIVELLIAMGYGGGNAEMGRKIGQSGDGGIDGVINEDPLGLDAVYIQAKRYDPANKVGRPALQAFVGSLTGESATKGVFFTTSGFSREAEEYVSRVQHRIVLIDGARLAALMMQHDVGVRAKDFSLLRLDEDYFSED